ncbi:unnamed protein product [Lepeophtheirus salmonis]|uniref:(salmon louse) hypothetical protein n=1 Tax=Lepeophtheirus salmonis TaxID=72036 RepID=A0A7R8H130_LEPSM|nr:unnamed protein product [Lepeophtheirus salmonis]CAF2801025.1 unnamed protein product [Lepeophtheirus salmonis]
MKRSKSSSVLAPSWNMGTYEFEGIKMNSDAPMEDSLITFPATPRHFGSNLSLLNQERRLEDVNPSRRRIKRSKSYGRIPKCSHKDIPLFSISMYKKRNKYPKETAERQFMIKNITEAWSAWNVGMVW